MTWSAPSSASRRSVVAAIVGDAPRAAATRRATISDVRKRTASTAISAKPLPASSGNDRTSPIRFFANTADPAPINATFVTGRECTSRRRRSCPSCPRRSACMMQQMGRADADTNRDPATSALGLPATIRACLFDLDGVLTPTAKVPTAAWTEVFAGYPRAGAGPPPTAKGPPAAGTEMFDGYLRERASRTGEPFVPFDPVHDYDEYVDGRPRYGGVRAFLASRGIHLAEGGPDDPPAAETVIGLGNRK